MSFTAGFLDTTYGTLTSVMSGAVGGIIASEIVNDTHSIIIGLETVILILFLIGVYEGLKRIFRSTHRPDVREDRAVEAITGREIGNSNPGRQDSD